MNKFKNKMLKNKQKTIFIIFFILSLIYIIFVYSGEIKLKSENKIIEVENNPPKIKDEIILKEKIAVEENISLKEKKDITINVFGEDYFVSYEEGDSVFDVMQRLASFSSPDFYFEYKKYPSLGVFVEKINGIKGQPGAYWIYYVNDKEAKVGVSKQILKSGDVVTWKQE